MGMTKWLTVRLKNRGDLQIVIPIKYIYADIMPNLHDLRET